MSRPVLVTGSHRSGTTWVGRMLCLSKELGYIHEPFNPDRRPGWTGGRIPHWFLHVTEANGGPYVPVLEDVLRFRYPIARNLRHVRGPRAAAQLARDWTSSVAPRLGRRRPLLKDPIALFAAEWLAQRFDAQVVVMIRHPAAFASSLKKLNWQFSFKPWLDQPSLMTDLVEPYRAEIQDHYEREVDVVDQAILMWKAMHDVIDGYRKRHPEWRFVRHEDLSAEPIEGFRALYHHLGLTWGERVERGLARYSSAGNPDEVPAWRHRSVRRDSAAARRTWLRRLTPDEIARVRAGVAGVSERFYGDDDWGA